MKDIKFVVLDVDGTIIDSKKTCRKIIKKIISPHSFFYYLYLKSFEGKLVPSIEKVIYKMIDLTERRAKKFRGVSSFLKSLQDKNVKVFGSTRSSVKNIKKMLEEERILRFFYLIKGCELIKIKHIPYFAESLEMDLEDFCQQAIYVGDEPGDAHLAKKLNVTSALITNTFTEDQLKKFNTKGEIVKKLKELVKK